MRRRSFLRTTVAGAALAACPGWIRVAFGEEKCDPTEDFLAIDAAAFKRAQQAGKPLLVLVIPAAMDYHRGERGTWFGELFNHGSPQDLAALSLVEVVASKVAPLRQVIPTVPEGEPLALLIETVTSPAVVHVIDWMPPPEKKHEPRPGDGWAEYEQFEDAQVDERIASMGAALRSAIVADAATVVRRAQQARSRLDAAFVRTLTSRLEAGAPVKPEDASRGAALVYAALLEAKPERATELEASLAAATSAQLTRQRVPGSKWATASGCGTDVEGEESEIVGCGMGHTPKKSERFLYFFTRSERRY